MKLKDALAQLLPASKAAKIPAWMVMLQGECELQSASAVVGMEEKRFQELLQNKPAMLKSALRKIREGKIREGSGVTTGQRTSSSADSAAPQERPPAHDETPIYVLMTTLPKRIGLMRPAIRSLARQTMLPTAILLFLPAVNNYGPLPDWLLEEPLVRVVRCERDWGAGTRYIEAEEALQEHVQRDACKHTSSASCANDAYVVSADDDVEYEGWMLEELVNCITNESGSPGRAGAARGRASFYCSHYQEPLRVELSDDGKRWEEFVLAVPFAVDGMLFHASLLQNLSPFASALFRSEQGGACRAADDVLIAYWVQVQQQRIRRTPGGHQMPPRLTDSARTGHRSYASKVHAVEQLHLATGKDERGQMYSDCITACIRLTEALGAKGT
jgi:hypothetical protein